jgi:hypothetical protein
MLDILGILHEGLAWLLFQHDTITCTKEVTRSSVLCTDIESSRPAAMSHWGLRGAQIYSYFLIFVAPTQAMQPSLTPTLLGVDPRLLDSPVMFSPHSRDIPEQALRSHSL